MDGQPRVKRRRRTLGPLMGAVAALAVVFALTKPFWTPATVRAAQDVLRTNGPKAVSGFDADHFRAASVVQMPTGWWQVRFVRVAGTGEPECSVMVPEVAVRKVRFRPW